MNINRRISTAADQKDQVNLVTKVIEWCHKSAPDFFDDSYVHSLYIQLENRGYLTDAQINALKNIASRFNIK